MKGLFCFTVVLLAACATAEITDTLKDTVHCSLLGFMTCFSDCEEYNEGIPNCCSTHFSGFDCTCKPVTLGGGIREPGSIRELLASQIGCAASSATGFWSGLMGGKK